MKVSPRKLFRTTLIVYFGQFASVGMFFLLSYIIGNNPDNAAHFANLPETARDFIPVFYAISIPPLLFIGKLKDLILNKPGIADEKAPELLQKYTIIKSVLCETPAVLGFVSFMLTGATRHLLVLCCVSLVALALNIPRFEDWKVYLEKHRVII